MWIEMLMKIFELCVIPLLGILVSYLVQWVRAQSQHLKEQTDSELEKKYIDMLENTISNCVIATNQTYVEALKKQGSFGIEEQKQAFEMTYNAVVAMLTGEAKMYLLEAIGDLQAYIISHIEAQVNLNK